jgi:hypothetical protein
MSFLPCCAFIFKFVSREAKAFVKQMWLAHLWLGFVFPGLRRDPSAGPILQTSYLFCRNQLGMGGLVRQTHLLIALAALSILGRRTNALYFVRHLDAIIFVYCCLSKCNGLCSASCNDVCCCLAENQAIPPDVFHRGAS